jgi:hypothetical protein
MNKQILTILFCAATFSAAHSRTGKNDSEYRKFCISVDGGLNYSLGTSGTVLQPFPDISISLPSASEGFGTGFDGAYFLTKNYGVGLKYRFSTANSNSSSWSEDVGNEYPFIWKNLTFKEQTHIFGPAVYARWFLGQSKWNVSANAGVVYFHNKLSNIKEERKYYTGLMSFEYHYFSVVSGHTGETIGFTLSAGIRYQLTQTIGIGVSANGLFASLSRMKHSAYFLEEGYETVNVSRKITRISISAGIDFSF